MDDFKSIKNKVDHLTYNTSRGGPMSIMMPNIIKKHKWIAYIVTFVVVFVSLSLSQPSFVTKTVEQPKPKSSSQKSTSSTTSLNYKKLVVWSVILSLPLDIALYFNISK